MGLLGRKDLNRVVPEGEGEKGEEIHMNRLKHFRRTVSKSFTVAGRSK